MAEQCIRSVHRESCGPQGRPQFPKRFSLVTLLEQAATVLRNRKPKQRGRYGEILEGLSGSKSVARRKRGAWNLGDPVASLAEGRVDQPERRPPDGARGVRSLHSTRGGSAGHMGKGATGLRSPQRKHEPDC